MSESPIHVPEEVSDQLNVLTSQYCRAVLEYFQSHSTEAATAEDLAGFVCEQDRSAENESRVVLYLHHATLPKLGDAGFLDYDPRSRTARHRSHPTVEVEVNHAGEREDPGE